MTRHCIHCGNELTEGGKFCPSCGKSIDSRAVIAAEENRMPAEPAPTPFERKEIVCEQKDLFARLKENFFTVNGRMNRLIYLECWIILAVISFFHGMFLEADSKGVQWIAGLLLVPLCISNVFIMIRRWHDLNKSGWWTLLTCIPLINLIVSLYLFCAKGTDGPNDYGDDPLAK